jgi:hypothetical protein
MTNMKANETLFVSALFFIDENRNNPEETGKPQPFILTSAGTPERAPANVKPQSRVDPDRIALTLIRLNKPNNVKSVSDVV